MNEEQTIYVVDVPVATIWTTPDSPREIDQLGLSNPLNIDLWYKQLNTKLRLELCDQNLVQSQLLYGEEVLIDEIQGDWAKIIAVYQPSKKDKRGYPGWVPLRQLKQLKKQDWNTPQIAMVTNQKATLYNSKKKPVLELSFATSLPVLNTEGDFTGVKTPSGIGWLLNSDVNIHSDLPQKSGLDMIQTGLKFLDLPYFWGGMSAYGYDCSGFTYNMHKAIGYIIPRDASDQALSGEEINFDQLTAGDLLFFAHQNGKGKIHHVGFYYEDGKMLHAPSTGKGIEITSIAGTKYEHELCKATRYTKNASML